MNKNKLRLTLGALSSFAIITIPIATVISCGEDKKEITTLNIMSDEEMNAIKKEKEIVLEVDVHSFSACITIVLSISPSEELPHETTVAIGAATAASAVSPPNTIFLVFVIFSPN